MVVSGISREMGGGFVNAKPKPAQVAPSWVCAARGLLGAFAGQWPARFLPVTVHPREHLLYYGTIMFEEHLYSSTPFLPTSPQWHSTQGWKLKYFFRKLGFNMNCIDCSPEDFAFCCNQVKVNNLNGGEQIYSFLS